MATSESMPPGDGQPKEEEGKKRSSLHTVIRDYAQRGVAPFIILFVIEVILFLSISALPFLPGEQSFYTNQGNQLGSAFQGASLFDQFVGIFSNNLRIALIEMVPVVGPVLFAFSLYETARVSEAIAISQNLPAVLVVFLLLLFFPHSWLELPAYAVATAESIFVLLAIGNTVRLRTARRTGAEEGVQGTNSTGSRATVASRRFAHTGTLSDEAGQFVLNLVIVVVMLAVAALFESVELQLGLYFWLTWVPFAGLIALAVMLVRRLHTMRDEEREGAVVGEMTVTGEPGGP